MRPNQHATINVRKFTVQQMRPIFAKRVLAVPRLQREFVWSAAKACDLLDSIHKGYPIGSALVWKTSRRNEDSLRLDHHILPPFDSSNKEIWFLIDGQQRLSVLWQLLRGANGAVRNSRGQTIDFRKILFDAQCADAERPFIYRQKAPSANHIPVCDLLSPGWKHALRDCGSRARGRAERCRRSILEYPLWITFLETKDQQSVRDTFIRINSLGTPIGAADRVFARASQFRLRESVSDIRERLGRGFDRLSSDAMLMTIALSVGLRDLGGRAMDSLVAHLESDPGAQKKFKSRLPRLRISMEHSIDYLREKFGVLDYSHLPSEHLVVLLSLFFFESERRRPSSFAKVQLRAWFWATIVGSRYAGRGWRPNLTADTEFMTQLAAGRDIKFKPAQVTPLATLRHAEYSGRSMLADGFFCLLRLHGPRYLEDGELIPLDSVVANGNRSDKHHIFPRNQLANRGISAKQYNSLPNICLLVARENQSIGSKLPRFYLNSLPQGVRQRDRALRSHLIPYGRDSGLWDEKLERAFKTFMQKRTRVIAHAFEEQAGIRLFGGDTRL